MAKTKAPVQEAEVEPEQAGTPYDNAESQTDAILSILSDLETEGGKVTSTHVAEVFQKTTFAKGREMDKLKALCSSTISLHKSKSRDGAPKTRPEPPAAPQPSRMDTTELLELRDRLDADGMDVEAVHAVAKLAADFGGLERLLNGLEFFTRIGAKKG